MSELNDVLRMYDEQKQYIEALESRIKDLNDIIHGEDGLQYRLDKYEVEDKENTWLVDRLSNRLFKVEHSNATMLMVLQKIKDKISAINVRSHQGSLIFWSFGHEISELAKDAINEAKK